MKSTFDKCPDCDGKDSGGCATCSTSGNVPSQDMFPRPGESPEDYLKRMFGDKPRGSEATKHEREG